ncbi:MAG: type IV pilus assembly protein FimV, partial [Lysobacteraceae bacterium]
MNNTLRRALAVALAIAAGPASALGLGQIQVKSHPGQPLLAEIPIISSNPAELQGLQVQLASPDTFRRIGLEPPQGDVSQLHFEPAIDAQGRPVIRVTSPAPVQQPLLTFLVEVDWSGGRLVREYSALVDTPRTVAAPAQPPVEAPVVAAPNTIATPEPPPVEAAPVPAATARSAPTPAASPAATPRPAPAQPAQAAPVAAPPPQRPVAPAPASRPARAPVAAASGAYRVQRGDTLTRIATGMDTGGTLDQAMLALLRANPQAFIDGNINRLKAGAVLRAPTAEEVSRIGVGEAAALVHEQIAGWRQARKPLAQPAGNALAAAAPARAASGTRAPAQADARLEIAPPTSAHAKQAGTRSGLEAGGEGEMLRQQLQETRETLAARDAEVQELKARVAELEKIQHDQQQLIALKSSALAAAQHDLAKANSVASAPATTTQASAPPAQPPAPGHGSGAWLWSGLALVAVALVGWLATRRRFA